jgi:Peptidase family M1 domain/Peptidase M1 N-terminal domain
MFSKGASPKFRTTRIGVVLAVGLLLTMGVASAGHAVAKPFTPGAAGAGDPYFPLDGNGGYDTKHYLLDVKYDPATDLLEGVVTIQAKATQNLSRFNLDLEGLTVLSVKVAGRAATWTRSGGELVITPSAGLRDGSPFTTKIAYRGVPETINDLFGLSGFIHTDDGADIVGEPHVADTWYPVNDHPSDKAAYTFHVTVPAGVEAVANGILEGQTTKNGWTTWTWDAKEPMASYLVTATMGQFNLHAYKVNGIRYWDAVDPDLYAPTGSPRTGEQFAISQQSEPSFKRLARTIAVPAGGATLSFWINRNTEQNWDYVFVEAHTVGLQDWTTLPDLNGHTSDDTGFVCPYWLGLHPFLEHYQTDNGDGTCTPQGTSGHWWAVSGESGGYEQWSVDLSAYAGTSVEVSISYASDDLVQLPGAFVDDIVVSTGAGTTSFEDDGNTFDGWTVPGAPPGSEPNPNDWIVGTSADTPPPLGPVIDAAFARQPEIIAFESSIFGSYPFSAAGGIVDDLSGLGFALENQTRPIYSKGFFTDPFRADSVIVHELAHQWYGDSLTVAQWQHIWLNEGFATYAEWLWSEREGLGTVQENFDFFYDVVFPPDDPFWQVIIGDPGPDMLFDIAVYYRGAMTLQQLRLAVGDRAFFRILRTWATTRAGGNVTTDEFIALAEQISHQDLDALFETWLFTPGKPELSAASSARSFSAASQGLDGLAGALVLKRLAGRM